jgi:hypothetical protein
MTAPVAAVFGSPIAPGRQETTLQPYSVHSRDEAGTVKLLGDQPVDHEQRPVLGDHLPGCVECGNGSRHVMQGLKDRHQVVPPCSGEVGGVGDGKPHSISHTGPLGVPPSGADGIVVQIDAVHSDVGIRLGHSDARPAGAACHVADPRWRFGPEPQVDVDNRREPFCAKQVDQSSTAGPGQLRAGKSLALSVFGRCGLENAEF